MKALDPSSSAPSAPGPMTALPAERRRSASPSTSGRLGPDHVQVGLDLLDRHVGDRDGWRHAGVARRHDHVRRAGQDVGERVLAASAADDADPHAVAKETVCSRPGPTPTRRTGTPICSERKAT